MKSLRVTIKQKQKIRRARSFTPQWPFTALRSSPHKVANNGDYVHLHKSMRLFDTEIGDNDCDTSNTQQKLIFDIRNTDNDEFISSIIFNDQSKFTSPTQCVAYDLWCQQSKVKFGFIPLTDSIIPSDDKMSTIKCKDPNRVA